MTGRRSVRREARRDEMLDAAMTILLRDGLDRLTIQSLASEVDAAVGAIYRYFPAKAALLVALQERAIRELDSEVAAAVESSRAHAARDRVKEPGLAALAHVVAALAPLVEQARKHPARHRLIDELVSAPHAILDADQLERVNAALAPLLERVETLLYEAESAGALGAGVASVRTRLLWAALHGLDHFRKRDRGEKARLHVERLVPEMLRALLVGFGGRPAVVDAAVARGLGSGPGKRSR